MATASEKPSSAYRRPTTKRSLCFRLIPEAHRRYYREPVIYLPRCYQPNDFLRPRPVTGPSRTEYDLPERGFVFCSFNNPYKITPAVFAVWMGLLRAVEGSVLWQLQGTAAASRNLRRAAAEAGVAPEVKVRLREMLPLEVVVGAPEEKRDLARRLAAVAAHAAGLLCGHIGAI